MKRIFSLILVMVMVLGICVPVVAANTATLLYSDSFETFAGYNNMRKFVKSSDYAKSGTYSMKAVGGNEEQTGGLLWLKTTEKVTLKKDSTYTISFYAMSGGTTAQISVDLYGTDNKSLSITEEEKKIDKKVAPNTAIPIGTWGRCVNTFTCLRDAGPSILEFEMYFGGESDIYIDDIEIYEGVPDRDSPQWQDAEYTEIVPGSATTASMVPDSMTLHNYTMDFENGSSFLISGTTQRGQHITSTEWSNGNYGKAQLIPDPADSSNTVMKIWHGSNVDGEGWLNGTQPKALVQIAESTISKEMPEGTVRPGETMTITFRYYLPQAVASSNNPSFRFGGQKNGVGTTFDPVSLPSTTPYQWNTAEIAWTNSGSSDVAVRLGDFRLQKYGANSWMLPGGSNYNFGDRALYFDDFRVTITDSNGNIVGGQSSSEAVTDGTWGNLYVDKDANAGGNGSKSAPFNTIEAARDYIRTVRDSMTGDIIVNVKGGRYEIENTIELTDADSGSNGHYVIYQPYGYNTASQESVTLSGGKQVTGWQPANLSGVSDVYKATLDVDYLRALYVNDKRAQRARYDTYVTPTSWWDDTDISYSQRDGFVIPGGIIKNPEAATNLEIYRTATFRSNWAVKGKAIANGSSTIIAMEQPYFYMHEYADYSILDWKETDNFRLENALEFLNEPGEWYHDADTNTLYYKLRDGETIDTCQVIAPNTEQILTVIGSSLDDRAENIIVRGFTISDGAYKKTSRLGRANLQGATCNNVFVHSDGKGYGGFQYVTEGNIILNNAKNISFTDNVIKHMAGSGIMMPDGVDNCEIKGNAIYDISSSAILVGHSVQNNVSDWRTIPRNVHITNNIIGDVGVEYGTDCGIQGYFTNGLVISHNEIYNTPYSAISMGWGWDSTDSTNRNNVIEYNRIYNYGTACQDGGGIYTLGKQPGSAVRGNYLRAYVQAIVGLYHDSGSAGIISSENVIELPDDSVEQGIYKSPKGDYGVLIKDNYTSHYERRFVPTAVATMLDNYTGQGATRSPEALSIRDAAGLEGGYKSLRDVVLGYSENTQVKRIYLQTEEQKHNTPANISVGQSLTLKTFGEGKNGEMAVLTSGVNYQVMDTSVLSLNGNKVTAVANGITTVKVTDSAGHSAIMTITVGDEVKSFEVIAKKGSAIVGEEVTLNYRLKTKYADFSGFPQMSEITISDTDVATVISDGTIKAVGNGTCTITVKTKVRGFSCEGDITFTVGTTGYNTYKLMNLMSGVTQSDIQNYLGTSATAKVSEEKFLGALAAITESDSSKISTDAGTNNLTKERMVGFAADALVSIYGVDATGDSELYYYTDRADISPSLVSKVALAYRNGLLSWIDGVTTFNPKAEVTAGDAAAFLYRFANPEAQEYIRQEEGYFNRYKESLEWLYVNTILTLGDKSIIRDRTNQWGVEAPGENIVGIKGRGALPTEPTSGAANGTNTIVAAIDSGALVRKIVRTDENTTTVTINNIFEAGKKYSLSFYAKLSSEHGSSKTNYLSGSPVFDVSGGSIYSTINSTQWKYFSTTIDIPVGTSITNLTNAYHIKLNNNWLDNTAYTVMFKDMTVSEETTVAISSSSIADGETDVLTPIDSVYIYTDVPVTTSSVTTDRFSITGGATIRDVEVISNQKIRVGIDGCVADSSYTLAVSGIPCAIGTLGGTLNDTISWSTAPANDAMDVYTLDFEGGEMPSDYITWRRTPGASDGSCAVSSENAYSGSSSLKCVSCNFSKGFVYLTCKQLNPNTKYRLSFYYSSEHWAEELVGVAGAASYETSHVATTSKDGWEKFIVEFTTTSSATSIELFLASFIYNGGMNADDTIYIDDLKVQEVIDLPENAVTVYRPNVFKGDIPVSGIKVGDLSVKLKIKGGATDRDAMVILAQYDAQNRMDTVVPQTVSIKAGETKTITIDLPKAKNLKTKIFVMGTTSYEPYNDAIILN